MYICIHLILKLGMTRIFIVGFIKLSLDAYFIIFVQDECNELGFGTDTRRK